MCPHEALRSILSALSQEVSHVCKDAGTEQSVSVCVCVTGSGGAAAVWQCPCGGLGAV